MNDAVGSAAVTIKQHDSVNRCERQRGIQCSAMGDYDYTVSKAGYAIQTVPHPWQVTARCRGITTDMNASRSTSAWRFQWWMGRRGGGRNGKPSAIKRWKPMKTEMLCLRICHGVDYDYTVTYANYNTVTGTATCRMQGGGTSASQMTYSDLTETVFGYPGSISEWQLQELWWSTLNPEAELPIRLRQQMREQFGCHITINFNHIRCDSWLSIRRFRGMCIWRCNVYCPGRNSWQSDETDPAATVND
jgi:hypothetical protein